LEHEYVYANDEAMLNLMCLEFHENGWMRLGATQRRHGIARYRYCQMMVRLDPDVEEKYPLIVERKTPK